MRAKAYVAIVLALVCLRAITVPMILPTADGYEDWRDAWIWQAWSMPDGQEIQSVHLDGEPYGVSSPIVITKHPVIRWGALAERESYIALPCLLGFALLVPLRRRTNAGVNWARANRGIAALIAFFVVSTVILIYPPCQTVEQRGYYRQISRSHDLVWDRGDAELDYGGLLLEIFAVGTALAAAYLVLGAVANEVDQR